jgi:hypothetical protein
MTGESGDPAAEVERPRFSFAVEYHDDDTDDSAGAGRACVHYYFPVEVEVIDGNQPTDPQIIADLALDRLAHSIRATRA